MAIKISGDTIIDDSRVIVNADKIGIGTTNPHVALEIFSGDVGIGTTNPNSPVLSSNTSKLAVGIITANTFFGNLVGGISDTGNVTVTGDLTVEGNTTLGDAVGDTLTVNATPTFKEDATFEKNVSIGGTLTYEDVTNVDSIGIVTAGKGLRVTQGGIKVNAGITTLMGNVGIGTDNPDDPVTSSNTNKLAVGIVTAHEFRGGTFYGTIDSDVSTISLDANLDDVFSVSGNQLSADSAGADKIVFWDNNGGSGSAGELTYLAIDSTTLEIDNTNTLKVKSGAVGKDYDLDFEGTTGGNGVGIVTWTLTDDVTPTPNKDPVTLKAGSNISISNVGATDFTIAAVDGAGVGIAASASQILNVNSGNIGGVNPGVTSDRIVYWNEDGISGGRLDYLDIGNGLEIVSDQLRVDSSVVGKSYELPVTVENGTTGNGGNSGIATVILRDTTNSIDDPVTIQAGSGIVIDSVTDGFKISADISGGGGGGISTVDVIQYSDNADPRTVRSAANPIDVQETVGIVTIGIGTTSNAYGNRFVGPIQPSSAVNGDIWYDTSTMGEGTTKVALIRHVESSGTNGGAATVAKTGWNTRKLNDLNDSGAGATLNNNIFSLPAGTYKIDFTTPFYHTSGSQSRLKYSNQSDVVSGTLSYITGGSLYAGPGSGGETVGESDGHDVIVLTETNYFILESKVAVALGAYDFGVASNYAGDFSGTTATQEVYSQVRIEDLATAVKDGAFGDKIEEGNTKAEVVDTGTNGHFLVETENTERLRITGIGSVGIGTTDPATKLDVFGDIKLSESNPEIQFNTGGPRFRVPADNTLSIHSGGDSGSESLERIRITGIGSVGIGTTNPLVKFRVIQGAGSGYNGSFNARTAAVFENYNTDGTTISILGKSSGYSGIFFGDESNEASGQIQYRHSDESFTFLTNYANPNRNALFISGDNNVGIGTSVFDTPVLSSNTSTLAVGIVTANKYYGDGSNLTGITAGGGSGSGNYESHISSFSGNDNVEFTNIPSWATKITLLGENVLLPEPSGNTATIGSLLEFGGSSGYLGQNAFMNITSFITKNTAGTTTYGISEYNNTPYAPYILLNNSNVGTGPILSQIHFTFEKVKNENKWVYSGSVANRKGDPSTTTEDLKFLNEFTGSFTATEAITKLKLSSFQANVFPAINYTGGTLTAIYEGEGGGGSGSGSSFVLLSEKPSTSGTEVVFDNIPADALEITLMFTGVSASGNNNFKIQLGTANGYITSGYESLSQSEAGGAEVTATDSFVAGSSSGTYRRNGSMTIRKASSNSYTQTGQFGVNSSQGGNQTYGSLSSVSGTVDRLKIILSGSDTFDAGAMSVSYKTSGSGGGGASSSPLSFRNLVHNGEMRIAQRIAYVSGGAVTSTMGYHIDRWKAQSDYTDVTVTQARFSSTSTDIVYQLGFAHFFRFALSAAGTANASAYLEVYQVIEGQNIISSGWDYKSSSSYITLSFWFRASTNQTFYCYLKTYDGTTYMYPFSFTASGNDTWTKITKTIPGNSNLTINTYFARGLQIVIVPFYGTTYTNNQTLNNWTTYDFNNRFPDMASTWLTAGASTFDLTGVQLEVGETATPFEHRTYQDDLAICRRYFLNTASGSFIFPQNNVYTSMRFPQQMRIAPTLTLTGTGTPGGILATIDGFRAYNSLGPQDFAVMANAELT